ncbi:hypothetical protein HW555_007053 [Spodoptera exigua]|uniref:Uncharacterized protein n=1 Tax=Spodoptera exigua TaxID=7107 RepID=A0A835L999_SPOEX|nr:hypothetical protein HW555_007053 [Spodoptera exigua]
MAAIVYIGFSRAANVLSWPKTAAIFLAKRIRCLICVVFGKLTMAYIMDVDCFLSRYDCLFLNYNIFEWPWQETHTHTRNVPG